MCCFYIFVLPVIFALGFVADVIVVPVAIVVGIPFFIIKQIIDKNKAKRNARERLRSRLEEAKGLQI
jgi:hypothetical protein